MDIVAQILTEEAGTSEKRRFHVSDLNEALDSSSTRRHVTLYPGDYASEWNGGTEVFIPSNVTVTLMPGAIVEYEDGYRIENFKVEGGQTYQGPPIGTSEDQSFDHPLNTTSDDGAVAERYLYPNFTGNVENITDLNLASEWAFKQEFERSLWSVKGKKPEENENGNRVIQSIEVPWRGTVHFDGGNKIEIDNEQISGVDAGSKVTVRHKPYNDSGNTEFTNTQTLKTLQTINVNDGHVINAEVLDLRSAIINNDGYITVDPVSVGQNVTTENRLDLGHAETGFADSNGDPAPAPTIPSPQNGPPSGGSYSVGLRAFETDDRGHVENIQYAPTVEEVKGGRGINVVDLEPGERGVREVSLDEGSFQTSEYISITDDGDVVDVSLSSKVMVEGENVSLLNNDAGYITGYTVTESDVTQHEEAITITESQISDLVHYQDGDVDDLLEGGTNVTLTYDDPNDSLTIDSVEYTGGSDITVDESTHTVSFDGLGSFTTDDLSEGSSNLYFTDERVDDRISNTLSGGTGINLSYDDAADSLTITGHSRYTDEEAEDAVNSLLVGGSNITLTYDDPADSLTIDGTDTQRSDEQVQDGVYNNVLSGTQTLIDVSYDDANNEVDYVVNDDLSQYDNSTSGFISGLSGFTTDDLSEGSSNLYYTDERAQDAVNTLLTGGTNVNLTYDDANDDLTIDATDTDTTYSGGTDISIDGSNNINFVNNTGYITGYTVIETDVTQHESALSITESQISDLSHYGDADVDSLLTGGSNVSLTYDSANSTLTIDGTDTQLSDEEVQDAVYSNVLSGTQTLISVTYDDTNNEVDYVVNNDLSQYDNSTSGFISGLSSFTTDDLSEGSSNFYYTNERVDDRVNNLLVGGANITKRYDDSGNSLTLDVTVDEYNLTNVSSNTTIGADTYYSVDTSGGSVTVTLDSAYATNGKEVNVKRNGSNSVTVDTGSTETIDGSSSITISSDDNAITLVYNSANTEWEIY